MQTTINKRVIVGNLYIYGECLETGKELNISLKEANKALRDSKQKFKVLKHAGAFPGLTECPDTGVKLGYWLVDNIRTHI